jgi:ribosomal protein L24
MKTLIRKNDKVVVIAGAAAVLLRRKDNGESIPCTVVQVDRTKSVAFLEAPKTERPAGGRELPRVGVELWKTVRYNQSAGEAGGLKIVKKPIHLSNLALVCPECGKRKFSRKDAMEDGRRVVRRVCRACKAEF